MLLLHYAVLPRLIGKGSRGLFSLWRRGLAAPWGGRRFGDLALSMGLAPTLYPQTTGCFSIQLRELVGGVGNAPIRRFRSYLTTPDLQSGNRNTSHQLVAGVGITPT